MPWKGVTVSEERQRFLEDYRLKYYTVSELAERFNISRRIAHPGLRLGQASGSTGLSRPVRAASRRSRAGRIIAPGKPMPPSSRSWWG